MECSEGIIVYNLRDEEEVEVCTDPMHLDSIIVYNSPRLFTKLLTFFSEKYNGFTSLIKLFIDNDLRKHFLGTHDAMNRTLARLRKLRYIINQESPCMELGFKDIFIMIVRDLDTVINALMYFRNAYHRVRDRAHQLIYPILKNILRRFLHVSIYYSPYRRWTADVYIKCMFRYDRYDNVVEKYCDLENRRTSTSKLITIDDVKEILRKQEERMGRESEKSRMLRQFWDYMDGKIWWNPYDDILSPLNDFLKAIS